jgi:Zn-dependent protease with chaperone function
MVMLAGAPTGLYGHVEENRRRSILLFGGFLIAIQLMALVALSLFTLVFDQGHSPLVSPGGYVARYVLPVAAVAALVYAARLWWFVSGVRKSLGFRYVDHGDEPRFCRILEPLCITAGIALPYAAVIESRAPNAFACGVRANHMVVVVTRGLLDELDDDELAAVLAHEITHIKNKDTMLLASANTFLATLLMSRGVRQVRFDDWRQMLGLVVMPILIPVYLLLSFLSQLALRIGYSSRAAIGSAREFIADAEAVRLTKNPAALVSALRKIEGRSRIDGLGVAEEAMMIDGASTGPLATHPTIAERIAALARTTGPMIFGGGTRLDTRAPARSRPAMAAAVPDADDAMMQAAALARTPADASMWQVFRRVRDPDRNILGFNRRGAIGFGLALVGVVLVAQTPGGARYFKAQRDILGLARDAGEVQKNLAACQIGLLGIEFESFKCDSAALDAKGKALSAKMGLLDNDAALQAQDKVIIELMVGRRCFNAAHDMTPDALTGPPQGKSYRVPSGKLRRAAITSVEPILQAAPGPARDQKLRDYAEFRLLMLGNALYFNGHEEMDALNANYHREDHQRAIALLGERLEDPAFTARLTPYTIGGFRVLAKDPFRALPCDVVP